MAKAQGLVGNFNGKVGNMVGFKVSQSNNGTSQGVRIYQPVRKNPKTAAQAEQRAKYAPIFATYRALKSIIDRGQESQPYGNASRIAWLKKAFRSSVIPWTPQGSTVEYPIGCQLTQGTLIHVPFQINAEYLNVLVEDVTSDMTCEDVSELSYYLFKQYPALKKGDQLTLVISTAGENNLQFDIRSYILDESSIKVCPGWVCDDGVISFVAEDIIIGASLIISREGAHGKHLRSTSILQLNQEIIANPPYDAASKTAAIQSYMTSGAENLDWSEEPI